MSWFDIAGALIGAGASIYGGNKSNKYNERIAAKQMAAQREFAQHGVRWRVEDAKAAGLHPLYALGAQVPGYQPVTYSDSMGPAISEAGQNIGGAISRTQTAAQRKATELQLRLLESQIGESDARAMAFRSEAFRNLQNQNPPMPEVSDGGGTPAMTSQGVVLPEGQLPTGLHNVKPQDSIIPRSNDRSTAAGINPGWSEFVLNDGLKVVLPTTSSDPAEALESIGESFVLALVTWAENKKRYGKVWADKFIRDYIPGGGIYDRVFGQGRTPKYIRMPDPDPKYYVPYEGY